MGTVTGHTGGAMSEDDPVDEVDAEMAAIAAQRSAGIRTVASAIATFIVIAFAGEFLLAEPIHLGDLELHRGYAYLFAPLAALIVGIGVFLRFRPKGGSFLDDTSLVATEGGGPRDAAAEDAAGLTSGRKAIRAKLAAIATGVLTTVIGTVGLDLYYTHRNEQPGANPWEYVPRLRIEIGEILAILGVACVLAWVVHRLLRPARTSVAAEAAGPMDADTSALYGDIARKSRQATAATLVGGLVGLVAAGATFYVLVELLEPRSPFDLRVLFGTALAGVLLGGGLRTLLLPEAMRDEGALDFGRLPAGSPEGLATVIGGGFTLSRRSSPLDLVGLGSRATARYELLVGGGVEGFVTEAGSPLAALALGGARPLSLIVSDGERRAMHVDKPAFGAELQIADARGQRLGHVRRSRIPFVRTLVVELGGRTLTLSKRWFSERYVLRSGKDEAAEARLSRTADDVGLQTRRVSVEVAQPEMALAALIGVLAMDAL